MRSLNGKYGILFVSFLLVFSTCLTATAHESHSDAPHALAEIEEHADELVELSDTLHVDSARIADDESLNEDLRATAESVHLSTHDMKHIGEHILSHVENLESLYSDPEYNADEINSEIAGIESEIDELKEIVNSNGDAVHTVESNSPASHQEYAESLHENFHEVGHIGTHLVKYTDELGESMTTEDSATTADVSNEEQSEQEPSATSNQTPGFGILMAVCGLLALGYFKRQ